MKEQIRRARFYFDQAEEGASQLHKASRWPVIFSLLFFALSSYRSEESMITVRTHSFVVNLQVWSSLMLYRMILDSIESNDYDNLTKRAFVGGTRKLMALPEAFTRSLSNPSAFFS